MLLPLAGDSDTEWRTQTSYGRAPLPHNLTITMGGAVNIVEELTYVPCGGSWGHIGQCAPTPFCSLARLLLCTHAVLSKCAKLAC